ncbi:hypothetical protein [Acidithiobacillus sp.]
MIDEVATRAGMGFPPGTEEILKREIKHGNKVAVEKQGPLGHMRYAHGWGGGILR